MELGYINFSQEELAKKNKVLQMVREQTAIDELGFGRIRDAFANLMFPGMSTLQRRAKYFAVMPSLYYQATQKNYSSARDVRAQILKWEINLTEMLVKGANGKRELLKGITGSSISLEKAKKDSTKFVKYDPTYIYINGMRAYDMIRSDRNIYNLILDHSREKDPIDSKYRASGEEEISDSDDLLGKEQLFSTSGVNYDFDNGHSMSLELTKREAEFLKKKIEMAPRSRDSLLAYVLTNSVDVLPKYDDLEIPWKDLPQEFLVQYHMGRCFSHFAYVVQLRYNHLVEQFNEQEEKVREIDKAINETISEYSNDFSRQAINEMLLFINKRNKISEPSIISFTLKAATLVEGQRWKELDEHIVKREKCVKPGRNKLFNPKYKGEERKLPIMMSFRWNEIVYRVITEIRNAL